MPKFGPIGRADLIRCFRALGFEGPIAGGRHQLMKKGSAQSVVIPNPHKGDISKELLARILRQAQIERDVWEQL
ncbi:MAG: type II toxin-antitoxin system HicA family toxin [Candidatus Hydrogenedentes bacterium]|nr:type II toxin-antitoxin system HicA family toxin [Candidatus Hydrogenedentota bacterium]